YIDNWAHLGGFLGGSLAALFLRPAIGEESRTYAVPVKALLAVAFTLAAGLYLFSYGYIAAAEANVWLYLGKKPAAMGAATRALAQNPANSYMYFFRGMLLFDAKQYAAAQSDFAEYLRRNPDSANALHTIGQAYYEGGQFTQAIAYYSQAIEREPGNVDYLNARGYTYILTGQYAAARADFTALLEIDAGYAPGWGNLGLVHAFEGDFPKAIELLGKAVTMDKSQAPITSIIAGLKFELRNQRTEAINNYEYFVKNRTQDRNNWLAEIKFAENRVRILRAAK
ncbi:MAG TPA: tetratricopeptide repeat protein, partial [Negativicutes bacterium]|nr:tetratricopeptide repeat protein [Negativicutes bacterium]